MQNNLQEQYDFRSYRNYQINSIAKWMLGAPEIQEFPLLAASS